MKSCVRCQTSFDATGKPGKSFCTKECARKARGSEFRKNRVRCLIRDSKKCRNCASAENLQVHHIQFLSQGGDNSLSYLITLCADPCHLSQHGKKSGKSKEGKTIQSKIEIKIIGGSKDAKAA